MGVCWNTYQVQLNAQDTVEDVRCFDGVCVVQRTDTSAETVLVSVLKRFS